MSRKERKLYHPLLVLEKYPVIYELLADIHTYIHTYVCVCICQLLALTKTVMIKLYFLGLDYIICYDL